MKEIELIDEKLESFGCKVEVYKPFGFLVNNKFIVASNQKKWCVKGKGTWYYYRNLDELFNLYISPNCKPIIKLTGDWSEYNECMSDEIYGTGIYSIGKYNGKNEPNFIYVYALGCHDDYRQTKLTIEDHTHKEWIDQYSSNLMYVGSTVNPVNRLQDHYNNGSGELMKRWITALRSKRKKPFMRLLTRVRVENRLQYEAYYCQLLYNRIRHNILNRSLIPELVKKEFKLDLEPIFDWDFEHECYSIGI